MPKSSNLVDVSAFTTDASFRAWGLTTSTAAQAAGLVKTSDTGQVNWATVTKPTATNTKAGYEIYRFNDTLQSTYPIYFRVDYGSSGVTSGNGPSTWITIGTGSNGSGTITGLGSAAWGSLQGYSGTTVPTRNAMPVYFCHVPGAAVLNFGNGLGTNSSQTNAGIWLISRTFDSTTGAATSQGAQLWRIGYSTGTTCTVYGMSFHTGTAFASHIPVSASFNTVSQGSMSSGNSTIMARQYVNVGYPAPTVAILTYTIQDIPTGSTFTATPFGSSSRTYVALGAPSSACDATASTNLAVAMLWEDTTL